MRVTFACLFFQGVSRIDLSTGMNRTRIIFTILFWILLSIFFGLISDSVLGDLSPEMQIFTWFFFLVAGTIFINFLWYWLVVRNRQALGGRR